MKNRYYRFFRDDGKALILAFDHGIGGDIWINPATVIKAAAAGGMDGILSTYGVLSNFRKEIGKMGTMLRLEVYGSRLITYDPLLGRPMGSPYSIEDCLQFGVDGVMTMGIIGNEYDTANLNYIAGIVAACNRYGIISGTEMLPNAFSSKPEDRTTKAMNIACRVAAEIGVDFVKTEYVKPLDEFIRIVANCYVPVMALGGAPLNEDRLVLENAHQAMEAGCKGLVIGRNVWVHKNIKGMAAALNKIVHEDATVDEALRILGT